MTVMRAAAALALAASVSLVGAADPTPCTLEHLGRYYDLRPLQSKTDYKVTSTLRDSKREFKLNVCGPVKSELWNPKVADDKVGAFFRGKDGDMSLGEPNSTFEIVDDAPTLFMLGGAACGGGKMSAAVRFECEPGAGVGSPKLAAQLPPDDDAACAFFFEWRTSAACPSNSSGGVGGLLVMFMSMYVTIPSSLPR
ncbi:mannose 6-phosphate receptor domain-containing protein [Exidia glandulosa HHB12029]|uniref:Mannose 6-phosphate receptor domain-containing protein n=1 Tax=Exidia glandulosa HHB12029 TaxID=1314781 RepID=A0A165I510_EXIGL|nr:mannose 6-phosphate receptor domain-containing protein [Exidia glandulosa HHB12029]